MTAQHNMHIVGQRDICSAREHDKFFSMRAVQEAMTVQHENNATLCPLHLFIVP